MSYSSISAGNKVSLQALPTLAPTFPPTASPTPIPSARPTAIPSTSPPTAIPSTASPTPWVLNANFQTTTVKSWTKIAATSLQGVQQKSIGYLLVDDGNVGGQKSLANPNRILIKNGIDISTSIISKWAVGNFTAMYTGIKLWICPPVRLEKLPTGTALTGPFYGGFYCGSDMYIPDNAVVILDGNNDATSKWVFSFSSSTTSSLSSIAFKIGKRSSVRLTNLASSDMVFWMVQNTCNIGSYSQFVGTVFTSYQLVIRMGALILGHTGAGDDTYSDGFARYLPTRYVLLDQAPIMGTCSEFAIYSKASVTFKFKSVLNYIDVGSIGVSPGTSATGSSGTSVNGSYIINYGTTQTGISTSAVTTCPVAFATAITAGITTPCKTILASSLLPSIMSAGVYCTDFGSGISAGSFAIADWSTVVLNGANISSSLWYFQATSIVIGLHGAVVLKYGALASNVYWFMETAVTLGTSSALVGNVYSGGTITFSKFARLEGRALADGAITLTGFNYVSTLYNYPKFIDLGVCFYFGVEGGPSISFSKAKSLSVISGWMGVSPGTTITGSYSFKRGGSAYLNTLPAQNCMISLKAAINRAEATICTNRITDIYLVTRTLTSGVYCSSNDNIYFFERTQKLSQTLTLDAKGDSSASWLFQSSGNIVTGPGCSVILVNNARTENVFWVAAGFTTIGASSSFIGTILSYGNITFGDLTSIEGRALSVGPVTFLGTTTVILPPNTVPTGQPSSQPSSQPTGQPSRQPTSQPTMQPTSQPISRPSAQPTGQPTRQPSHPTSQPTGQPSMQPSGQPSSTPTHPTGQPTTQPSCQPTGRPTGQPTRQPTSQPTGQPTGQPTRQPTGQPTMQPTGQPTRQPTGQPTMQPTGQPTGQPTRQPTGQPTGRPTMQPTGQPTRQPTGQPSGQPTIRPSGQPTCQPTVQPTAQPTVQPTGQPTRQPTGQPSGQPTICPSGQPTCLYKIHLMFFQYLYNTGFTDQ